MLQLFDALCRRLVRKGALTVHVGPSSVARSYGDGSGVPVVIRLPDETSARAIALDPGLAVGEAYMDGRLTIEQGDIYDFLMLVMANQMTALPPGWVQAVDRLRLGLRRVSQWNGPRRAARNVAHHYDLSDAFYELFLDPERQYSCAYFEPGDDLATAQRRKMRHVTAKLQIGPGHKVLDIGSGWGGLAHYIAAATGADVTGITLSKSQLAVARERAFRTGAAPRVRFDYTDWREAEGRFDRIVSVGMFEHVGVAHYERFFRQIVRLLKEDGVALVHTIGRSDGPGFTNPFIAKHIFPGGYFPALSEMLPAIERSGAMLTDVEVLRLHYAETLRAWRRRFRARWTEAVAIAGEPFCRGWEFYLAGSEAAFRCQGLVVFQVQLARRVETLPITRDYIAAGEHALELRDGVRPKPPSPGLARGE